MKTFTNDGFTFEVDDSGPSDGDAIVLLHGFPETNRSWQEVAPLLAAAGYRVLAPNGRGYARGARPRGRRDYTLPKLTGDVLALADAAGADRFHVVGHDWGGIVLWALAAGHPERVRTASVLATPHPRAFVRSTVRSGQLLKSWYMALFQLPVVPELAFRGGPIARRFRDQLVSTGMPADCADDYMAVLAEPGAARGAINYYRGLPLSPPFRSIGKVAVPTLYVYATDDMAIGRTSADLTGDYVTGPFRYEVLEGVSHWIPEEVPELVAELVLDFIGKEHDGNPR